MLFFFWLVCLSLLAKTLEVRSTSSIQHQVIISSFLYFPFFIPFLVFDLIFFCVCLLNIYFTVSFKIVLFVCFHVCLFDFICVLCLFSKKVKFVYLFYLYICLYVFKKCTCIFFSKIYVYVSIL
jgi:hypothetical protein